MSHLIVITGPMFAQKTSKLIQDAEDAVIANDVILALKPVVDDREERNFFTKINENPNINKYGKIFCEEIKDPEDILRHTQKYQPDIILIDEVQFFGQRTVTIIQQILDEKKNKENFNITAAGLETDFRRELFGPTHQLMAIADKVNKLKAVCNRCKKKNAIFTWRRGDSSLQVVIGGKKLYEARCRKCYPETDPSPT